MSGPGAAARRTLRTGARTATTGSADTACARQLLLGYLPPETGAWAAALAQKRAAYAQFCAELIVDPKGGGGGGAAAAAPDDHPLSQSDGSKWHAYFKARHAPGLRGRARAPLSQAHRRRRPRA